MKSRICRIGVLAAALLSLAPVVVEAQAAPKITLTAAVTSGVNTVTPVLTWVTTPVADSCTASGTSDWTGSKPDHGTVTLAAINSTQTYSIACTWLGGTATLNWTNPTANTDGTPYTDPAKTRILLGTAPNALNQTIDINLPSPPLSTRKLTGLAPAGMWYFAVETLNAAGQPSDPSNVVSKNVLASDVNVSQSVGIVVYKQPGVVTNVTVQ